MSAFDNFQRAAFAGVEFPWEERTVQGAVREHQHKYPHTAGAALETLGRELYVVNFKATFQDTLKGYPDLYPSSLARLRRFFETETRADLVIPGIGTIQAVCIKWSQHAAGKQGRSGEKVDLEFLEDIEDAFLVNNLIGVSAKSLNEAFRRFSLDVDKIRADQNATRDLGLFDSITNSVNSVLAVVDTAQAYGDLVGGKILGAAQLVYQADRRAKTINDPKNFELMSSMMVLWDALLTLHKDVEKTGGQLQAIVTLRVQSVVEISRSLYAGDGTRAIELMQLNNFTNPFAVTPGTTVRYYPGATQ